jgi:hypothetical protein
LRRVLLGILNGTPAVLRQLPVAARLLLCEDERCLRPINLSLVGADWAGRPSGLRIGAPRFRFSLAKTSDIAASPSYG